MAKSANQTFFAKFKLNRDLYILLLIGGLYALATFLSNTFVNVFLWRQAGDYITIASYNLATFFFHFLSCLVAGKLVKKMNRVYVLRLGVTFLALFYIVVLFIGESAATYPMLLGSVLGIGSGLYWLSYNLLTFEITEPDTRDLFNGVFGILESVARMIGPVLAGFIIARMDDFVGYITIFSISFSMFIIAVICSFFLHSRVVRGKFYIKEVISQMRTNQDWGKVIYAHFFQGLREGIYAFVITIWVYIVTKSELSLGMFNLYISGMSFIFYFLTMKFIKNEYRKRSILWSSLILYLSLFIFLPHMTYMTLVIYALVIGIFYPLLYVPYTSMSYDVIGEAYHAKELRVEYIVLRELSIHAGKILSVVIFLLTTLSFGPDIIPTVLIILGLSYLLIYYFLKDI